MNNDQNLNLNDDENQESSTPSDKGARMRANVLGLIQAPTIPGCYVLAGLDAPQVHGDNWAATDLLPGYDYVIVPVERKAGRPLGLGWVKFE